MEKAEILSFPTVIGSGGRGQSLQALTMQRKNFGLFGLFRHLKCFSAYFYAGCLEAEIMQKNFGPKKLRTFFHETITVFSEPWPPRVFFSNSRKPANTAPQRQAAVSPPEDQKVNIQYYLRNRWLDRSAV
jgi:hypothetical protein